MTDANGANATTDEQKAGSSRRLGRGLNALLGANPASAPSEESNGNADSKPVDASNQIHVELIERNPYQARQDFEPGALQELADSIKLHGLLQPILVRPHDGQYQLIAGERRLLAAKKAGLDTVPCNVMELEERNVFEVAIEENLKRKDLNVLEKAKAFQEYLDKFQCKKEELAKRLSMDRSTVSNLLRLLDLNETVKIALRKDQITNGHARALLPLDDEDQIAMSQRIQKEGLSVRKTEQAVKELLNRGETVKFPEKPEKKMPELSPHLQSVQKRLQDQIGLKVEIKPTNDQAGKVVIHFNSHEDFDKLIQEMKKAA